MSYVAVKDLKKTRELWRLLEEQKDLIITRDGKPCALLVSVTPETAEQAIREVRRGLFSLAVQQIRQAAAKHPISEREIEEEIAASRRSRGLS